MMLQIKSEVTDNTHLFFQVKVMQNVNIANIA